MENSRENFPEYLTQVSTKLILCFIKYLVCAIRYGDYIYNVNTEKTLIILAK